MEYFVVSLRESIHDNFSNILPLREFPLLHCNTVAVSMFFPIYILIAKDTDN